MAKGFNFEDVGDKIYNWHKQYVKDSFPLIAKSLFLKC